MYVVIQAVKLSMQLPLLLSRSLSQGIILVIPTQDTEVSYRKDKQLLLHSTVHFYTMLSSYNTVVQTLQLMYVPPTAVNKGS